MEVDEQHHRRRALAVVVVAYGEPLQLETALSGLEAETVIVVDNSSSKSTADVVGAAGASYVDPGANVGFARGVNIALRSLADLTGRADVLLMNPDARIELDDVRALQACLDKDPTSACCAPWHSAADGSVKPPVRPWDGPVRAWADALGMHSVGAKSGFLSGAVLLLRAEAVTDVGMLDERFFMYTEDEDWQKRAQKNGWRLCHCRESTASHVQGGTDTNLSNVRLRLHAALELYVRKWYGPVGWQSYRLAWLVGQGSRYLGYSVIRKRRNVRETALALLRIYWRGPFKSATEAGLIPSV